MIRGEFREAMKALAWPWFVACVSLRTAVPGAQTPVGALEIDARQGAQYGWAVDYECQRSFKIPPPAVIENSPTPG